jgi:hypothetical protein
VSGNIRIIRHDNRELFTSFKEWIECEEDSRAAYVDWLLRDHSDNPDLGIQFSRSREGRGYWWSTSDKSWTTWGKPFVLMDRIQQRCVILALENIYIFIHLCHGCIGRNGIYTWDQTLRIRRAPYILVGAINRSTLRGTLHMICCAISRKFCPNFVHS